MKKHAHVAALAVVVSFGGIFLWRSARGAHAPPPQASVATVPPTVDLVFALDTTGSMGGLLEGAKAKIWEVARRAQEGKPSPKVRVGLVAYRDVGDAYVTQVLDLTTDLDKVYATLTGFKAEGGGDGPEHVLKGLHDAVDGVQWSQDPSAVKLVYLVGDAEPHLDYKDGLTMDGVLGDATKKGIRISAIRCGNDNRTLAAWTQIAQRTDGEVATIEQTGGVVAVTTPYDDDLAHLNADLARTEVHYGTALEQREADDVVRKNLAAPHAAQADRAAFYGSSGGSGATKADLAAAPSASAVADIPVAALPPALQAMSADERVRFVEEKQKERQAIMQKVRDMTSKREEFLRSKAPAPAATSFDSKVYASLKKAGSKKGISF